MHDHEPAVPRPAHPAEAATPPPPSLRTCTFLLTDIEGSTRLWELHFDEMRAALRRHDALLRAAVVRYGGEIFKQVGDAFHAVFPDAAGAVAAAVEAQRALWQEECEDRRARPEGAPALHVRMALYTGVVEARDGDFYGPTLNRGARIRDAVHGGQIALAESTRARLCPSPDAPPSLPEGAALRDLGSHRLRDLLDAERLYQVVHPDLPGAFPPLRTLTGRPNNLPYLFTSFVGRDAEMAAVRDLLLREGPERPRLVTLTGVGGAGKTRLSVQVGADVLDRFEGGVYQAELGAVTDPEGVTAAVAAAVGARQEPGRALADTLAEHLCRRPLLLILDNCEHLLDECARLADHLLRRCPDVTLMATSREPLGIPGEACFPVPPLVAGLEEERAMLVRLSPEEAQRRYPALKLFVDRAAAASHRFALTERNLPAVAEICRHLDGLPLAIELAAAWVGSVPPEQIVSRLTDRFRLLKDGNRAALPRHQTLRAAIDWSYALLSEPERVLLRRLSVFSGGVTLEAAERVCADDSLPEPEVVTGLLRLARKSLIAQEEVEEEETAGGDVGDGASLPLRFRLLESIREYGRELLAAAPPEEPRALRDRHLDWCLTLAQETEPHLFEPSPRRWLDRLESEHGNLRAALSGDSDLAKRLRLASSVYWFWRLRGHFQEGCRHFARLFAEIAPASDSRSIDNNLRAKALKGYGILAWSGGNYATAEVHLLSALEAFRGESGTQADVASCLNNLAMVAQKQEEFARAESYYQEALACYTAQGNITRQATVLGNLGALALHRNELDSAIDFLTKARQLHQHFVDTSSLSSLLTTLGEALHQKGYLAEAAGALSEALSIRSARSDVNGLIAALVAFSQIAHEAGESHCAAFLLSAADSYGKQTSAPTDSIVRSDYDLLIYNLREKLGEDSFTTSWNSGSNATIQQAVQLATSIKIINQSNA